METTEAEKISDVTLPNGFVVSDVPDSASKEEIKQEALKNGWAKEEDFAEAPKAEENTPASDRGYIVDQALRGTVDMLSSIMPDFIQKDLLGMDFKEFQNADGTFRVAEMDQYIREKEDAQASSLVGYEGVLPNSKTEEIAGAAVRSLTSEGPLAVVGSPKTALGVAGEVLFSATAAATGAAAQAASTVVGNKWGLPTWGTEILGAVTGAVATTGTGLARGAVQTGAAAGSTLIKNRNKAVETVDSVTDYVVASEMKTVIDKATTAQPNIEAVIHAVKELEGQIPGLTVPPAATLADNPIFKKNTEQLLRTDPSFFASAKKSLTDAKEAINTRKEQLFGKAGPETDKLIRDSLPKNFTARIKSADKRMKETQDRIDTLVEKALPKGDTVAVGQAIDKLMTAKTQAVRDKLSPLYENLINKADKTAVMMEPTGVRRVHQVAEIMKVGDNFASFPELMLKIRSEWQPTEGQAFNKGAEYPEVSAREVDSLKRAINKSLRQTKDPDKVRMLNMIKTELRGSIQQNMPESFAKPYADLDAQYYTELGVPMNTQGVRQLDSTRFAAQAGEYLSKPEQSADFLSFVGESGIPVVRDAIMLKMEKAAINKDGQLDGANLQRFIRRNARSLKQVPGLANELGDLGRTVQNLSETRARMDADNIVRSKELTEGFLKGMHGKKLEGVVVEILNSPANSAKYMRDLKNFTPETAKLIKQGVRAGILENGMTSNGKSMLEFIQSNKNVMDTWFGKTYSGDVRALALASDQLNKLDLDKMRFAVDYKSSDVLSEKVGISMTQLQSIARDRIVGLGTKLALVGSKINTASTAKKRDSQMTELLLNPEALKTIKEVAESKRLTITNPQLVEKLATTVHGAVSKGVYFGISGAEQEAERAQEEDYEK